MRRGRAFDFAVFVSGSGLVVFLSKKFLPAKEVGYRRVVILANFLPESTTETGAFSDGVSLRDNPMPAAEAPIMLPPTTQPKPKFFEACQLPTSRNTVWVKSYQT
jgi:hypothetical protein